MIGPIALKWNPDITLDDIIAINAERHDLRGRDGREPVLTSQSGTESTGKAKTTQGQPPGSSYARHKDWRSTRPRVPEDRQEQVPGV